MSLNTVTRLTDRTSIPAAAIFSASRHSRLIPGRALTNALLSPSTKKKAQSVQGGQGVWTAPSTERAAALQHDPLRSFASSILPQPDEPRHRLRLALLVAADIAAFALSFLFGMACFTRTTDAFHLAAPLRFTHELVGLSFLQAILITLLAQTEGVYRISQAACPLPGTLQTPSISSRLLKCVFWSTILLAAFRPLDLLPFIVAALTGAIGLVSFHAHARQAHFISQSRNVLILGATPRSRAFASYLRTNSQLGKNIIGFLDDRVPRGFEVLGSLSDLDRIARANFVDEVLIALPDSLSIDSAVRMATACRLDVSLLPDLPSCAAMNPAMERFGAWTIIQLREETPPRVMLAVKRCIDIVGALSGLILSSPVLAMAALSIKLDSPGPILYSARRVGQKGHHFRCHKFRTMSVDADSTKQQLRSQNQRQGPFFKIKDDPRITRAGRVLRKYSIDELPQLWNVLRGDMSLVGPRPHPLDDFTGYRLTDLCRLDVKPGLTGLWQTTARRDPSFETAMRLDRQYIENWSLALDSRILFRTVGVVLAGGGC